MHALMDPSSSPTLINADMPLLFGGGGPQWAPLTNGAMVDVWLSCSDELEEKCIKTLTHCLCACILWVHPSPTPSNNVIDRLFNAQTNSSLIISGYFLSSLLSQPRPQKRKKAAWNELGRKFYLLNKSGNGFISVKWNCRWVVWLSALKKYFLLVVVDCQKGCFGPVSCWWRFFCLFFTCGRVK